MMCDQTGEDPRSPPFILLLVTGKGGKVKPRQQLVKCTHVGNSSLTGLRLGMEEGPTTSFHGCGEAAPLKSGLP